MDASVVESVGAVDHDLAVSDVPERPFERKNSEEASPARRVVHGSTTVDAWPTPFRSRFGRPVPVVLFPPRFRVAG